MNAEDREIRAMIERYLTGEIDHAKDHELYHDDAVLEFPQGGERLVGLANIRAMREAYPAAVTFSIQRIRGGDDLWVTEVAVTYDGGPPARGVAIMELRDGRIAHETIYFGEPWEPPAWRAQWVESMA